MKKHNDMPETIPVEIPEIEALQRHNDELKKINENYVEQINKLTAQLQLAATKLNAYQIVMSDIVKGVK